MDAIILDNIPFTAELEMFTERMRLQKRPALVKQLAALLEEAKGIARPKVMFKELPIEKKGEDLIVLDGVSFRSRDLRQTVADLPRVFPTIATCGHELGNWAAAYEDMMVRFFAEVICEAAMTAAQEYLAQYVAQHHGAAAITYILPGTLDWPITDQDKLFALIGDTAPIGVYLTEQGTMRPIKTVSALYYETA
ncbi:MAG TPA: hypothetical protein DCE00_03510 [Firmicutes bacterium]|jgi:hypothetical protein|nr:hypothetical protein [Bacillota bacterium]HAA37922.1 hypothetical protein [Bacillota bacterium]